MSTQVASRVDHRSRSLLVFCCVAVAFAAVDTYVVVLALPDMMGAVSLPIQDLQRAAPIISGFLLGYVAMLPLIGRIADLRGPVPVLVASLVVFTVGSLITAEAYDLASMVAGRFLQGAGGGGLVPATMSLVAALYPVERRGLPLGLVSAVQEFGSVLGPLFGAAVLAFSSWRAIFLINCGVGLLLALAVRSLRGTPSETETLKTERFSSRRFGASTAVAALALLVAVVSAALVVHPPESLYTDLTYGEYFIPVVDGAGRWLWPVGLIAIVAFVVVCAQCLVSKRPLVDVRAGWRSLLEADLVGSAYLALALGGVVLAFATADPEVSVFSAQGPWYLIAAGFGLLLLLVHLRRADDPLVPRGTLVARPAWGSLVVSLLIGWALIAALVDIPLFARTTVYGDSQLDAALVLLRFLVALPIGAVIGGWLVRRAPSGLIAGGGMALSATAFLWMAQWGATSLSSYVANVPLLMGGLGFGLALAPVNAAMLACTRDDSHGIASALVVVARMVGMLVGISVLTTWGLHRLYQARDAYPADRLNDTSVIRELGILQEHAVFEGAAIFAALAAVAAVVLFHGAPTRGLRTTSVLRAAG